MNKLVPWSIALLVLLGALSIPLPEEEPPQQDVSIPFVWNQDAVWDNLEKTFVAVRSAGCRETDTTITGTLDTLANLVDSIDSEVRGADDPLWGEIETVLFPTAAMIAACPDQSNRLASLVHDLRARAKEQSIHWDLGSVEVRHRLYRILYGSRTALEEVIVQGGDTTLALYISDQVSEEATPTAEVHGVTIRSGDLLVSRGGYPTSALISRGSDYPGNFSHVALAHVDSTGSVSVVEAHISVGVTVSSAEEYLADKKLRLMVLRMRSDHPLVEADPLIAHRAATTAIERARVEHIPYDFEMNYGDSDKLFCSEVASSAYSQSGVTLWTGISTISREGLRAWLSAFGVRYFETQEPSDLEYDPQLVLIAEWRDLETLKQDRIDNAVVDAMLESAEDGQRLGYPWYMLAPGRLAKAFSAGMNTFGGTGPIPEGMSTPAALRNRSYTAMHNEYAARVESAAEEFRSSNGYEPPYWQLVSLARTVVADAQGS